MNNLLKIKNLCKSLAKEFGDTQEGQGYLMLGNMLEKEPKAPESLQELIIRIDEKFNSIGVKSAVFRMIEVQAYSISNITYRSYCTGENIERQNPKDFLTALMASIDKNAEKLLKEQTEKILNNNIAI